MSPSTAPGAWYGSASLHTPRWRVQSGEDPVSAYFDRVAGAYRQGWDRWPFDTVRRHETAAVQRALGDVHGARVLELGAGKGHYTRLLGALGAAEVVAVDRVASMVADLMSQGVTPVVGDAATVWAGEGFSLVLSAGMLEFVDDAAAVLRNAARHCEAPGALVLLVPRDNVAGRAYRAWHARHGLTVRLFGDEALGELLAATGWRLQSLEHVAPFTTVCRSARA